MQNANTVRHLKKLIALFRSWDDVLPDAHVGGNASGSLSPQDRRQLLHELCGLARCMPGDVSRGPTDEAWGGVLRLFAPRPEVEERRRREVALLGAYEALCDRDPPFAVSIISARSNCGELVAIHNCSNRADREIGESRCTRLAGVAVALDRD